VIEQYVSREEFRRLVSSLLVTVGAITIFALFAFIVVPGLRNANRPSAAPSVAPPQGETGWLDPTEYPPTRGYELPPVDPETVLTVTPDVLARGRTLFQQNCTSCHGESGQADGPASSGLNPPARNFTRPDGWKNGHQLTAIYKTLSEGIRGSSMGSFDYLKAEDRMAIAHYVQSLAAFPRTAEDPAALDALAQQFASAGQTVPNKIPVSMAIDRLEEEFTAPAPLPPVFAGRPEGLASQFLARAVPDPARAAQTLTLAPAWRQSAHALAKTVVAGTPGNGFSASVATLSPSQWQVLHAELLKALPRAGS
jgi:mono/diheme cytochrome c family protein